MHLSVGKVRVGLAFYPVWYTTSTIGITWDGGRGGQQIGVGVSLSDGLVRFFVGGMAGGDGTESRVWKLASITRARFCATRLDILPTAETEPSVTCCVLIRLKRFPPSLLYNVTTVILRKKWRRHYWPSSVVCFYPPPRPRPGTGIPDLCSFKCFCALGVRGRAGCWRLLFTSVCEEKHSTWGLRLSACCSLRKNRARKRAPWVSIGDSGATEDGGRGLTEWEWESTV